MRKLISRAFLPVALLAPLVALGMALWVAPHRASAASAHRRAGGSRLTAVDAAALRQKLAALKGKVVVLNVWATWCGPCVSEFPGLVKFDRAYRRRGVTVIGLSMDDPSRVQQVVPPFLARNGARFTVYALKPVDPGSVVGVVDKGWTGAIPMTYVIDRSGQVRTRLVGARGYDDFEAAIRPLLRG